MWTDKVFSHFLHCIWTAKLLLGDVLKEGSPLSINPLVLWAWTGLIINAVNSIPTGELDGGRISFAIWGRKVNSVSMHALVGVIPIVIAVLTAL